jgi:cyclic pyranopterin monophosphate synthase
VGADRPTHLDAAGAARMVDVGGKAVTERRALARSEVRMRPETAAAVARGDAPKGDVVTVARIAGIQAAKRTADLVPLCHPLPLTHVDVRVEVLPEAGTVEIESEARTEARTGVEMEAMTASAVAALTVYDMVKGLERGVRVAEVWLVEKTGGKEDWREVASDGRAG